MGARKKAGMLAEVSLDVRNFPVRERSCIMIRIFLDT